jgi:hypothetical protein
MTLKQFYVQLKDCAKYGVQVQIAPFEQEELLDDLNYLVYSIANTANLVRFESEGINTGTSTTSN